MAEPAEIHVHPPDSLLRFEPPVFVGIEPSRDPEHRPVDSHKKEASSQLDDMLNSMLQPRSAPFTRLTVKRDPPALHTAENGWKSREHGCSTSRRNRQRA
jgi:hypothetical protein